MKRILKEDQQMMGDPKPATGISTSEGMAKVPFNPSQNPPNSTGQTATPFEADRAVNGVIEILQKSINLVGDLNKALDNPSVSESKKIEIKKAISRLTKINRILFGIPHVISK